MASLEAGQGGPAGPQVVLQKDSWVQCDRCDKWRRIPQAVADTLAEDAPWYCEMNTGSIYNDCDVPQELTDQQIDQIHEEQAGGGGGGAAAAEEEEPGGGGGGRAKLRKRPPVWQVIKQNIYTHRGRKEQDEDDIMICQCPRLWGPPDPSVTGCGPNCLNRMLNIECVTEFCPCGERCSNQMFTRREYAALEVRRAGAKGFGLFTSKALKAGDFIIEYIGEVLEEEEYHRRKEFYIKTGQRHYYFMNVGNGEVIDACRKGGLGRFINHSCDPNCETQKWLVNGELAIGLFAIKDVEAGSELTFDYNFERYGDKPMKCLCASKSCRGIIGGTQESRPDVSEALVPAGAEDEPEPIMVTEEEEDKALAAILDRVVGLGWEQGWNSGMQRRLSALAASHGIDLDQLSEGEEEEEVEEESEGDEEISDISSEGDERPSPRRARQQAQQGLSGSQEGSEAGEVSGGAAPAASSGRQRSGASPTRRPPSKAGVARRGKQQRGRQQQRRRRGAQEPEEEAEGEAGTAGAGAAWEEAQAAAALAAKLHVAGSKKQRILAANAAAKAAALASQQLPMRKRLKKLARAVAASEQEAAAGGDGSAVGPAGAAVPATSTASQKSAGALARLGKQQQQQQQERATGAGSVASTSTALAAGAATAATTTPLIPRRASATPAAAAAPSADRGSKVRRRSEIDRRLDELVGASGRLRDTSPAAIIRFLRLFNLCDIGPTLSKAEEAARQHRRRERQQQRERERAQQERGPPARPPSPAMPPAAAAQAAAGEAPRPASCTDSGNAPPPPPGPPGASSGEMQREPGEREATPVDGKEEGEVSGGESFGAEEGAVPPEPPPPPPGEPPAEQQQQQQQRWEQRSEQQAEQRQRESNASPTRSRGYREDEGASRPRAVREEAAQQRGELSPRQRARLADMSLLLDVVLKTNTLSARREFVQCGILRQLLATIGHNVGTQYAVILRKVIRVVESLPFSADDMHHTRSAHGSFADLLRELAQHSDYEVRNKSWGLLRQYPMRDCTRPVVLPGGPGPGGPGAPPGAPPGGPQPPQPPSSAGGGSSSRSWATWAGGPQWDRRELEGPPLRSPSVRGDGPPPMSPGYPPREGRSPHRELLPPSRLGGMHRGPPGRPPPREPFFDGRGPPSHHFPPGRPPFGPDGPHAPPHHFPPGRPPYPPRGFPGGPRHHPGEPGPDGRGPEGREPHWQSAAHRPGSGPPHGEPGPLPRPLEGRAAAESIAAALVSSAGGTAGAAAAAAGPEPGGGAPLATVPPKRRKRSRWEGEEQHRRSPPQSAPAANGEGRPGGSLLPPGFGGGQPLPQSPPSRPPSILTTAAPVRETAGEPPSKRAAGGGSRRGGQQQAGQQDVDMAAGDGGTPDAAAAEAAAGRAVFSEGPSGSGGGTPDAAAAAAAAAGGPFGNPPRAGTPDAAADAGPGGAQRSPRQSTPDAAQVSPVREHGPGAAAPLPPAPAAALLRPPVGPSYPPPAAAGADGRLRGPSYGPPLPRAASGTLSDASRGESGGSGPPPRGGLPPRHPLAAAAAAVSNGAVAQQAQHMSPMTSSQSLPGANGTAAADPAQQATAESALAGDAAFFRPTVTVQDESWDEPSTRFELFVGEVVRARIGKYVQPGHPAKLDMQEAMQLYKKVSAQVVAKEHEAYAERQRSGLHKPIVRSKLEAKIRDFVRDSVRRILVQRGQGGAA